jgi:IrrE N-terminal-like domain
MSGSFNVRVVAAEIVGTSDRTARTFPRDVESAALSLPVHVELIQGLTLRKIDAWLHRHLSWSPHLITDNRQLRGCLVAHRGRACIFLEASETKEQRRFTLSHELAHFIGHYLAARKVAIARFGPSIGVVLDGDRRPSPAERLSGVLIGCPLGVYQDVLDRDGSEPVTAAAERMEAEADAAAFMALAPSADVAARCRASGRRLDRDGILQTLQADFGLASTDAIHHLPVVLKLSRQQAPTLVESLRAAATASGKTSERST